MPEANIRLPGTNRGRLFVGMLPGSSREGWCRGKFRIEALAQDQVVFQVERDQGIETYRGRRAAIEDAQSELPAMRAPSQEVTYDWRTLVQSYLTHTVRNAWNRPSGESAVSFRASEVTLENDVRRLHPFSVARAQSDSNIAQELLELDLEKSWPRLREVILLIEDRGFEPTIANQIGRRLLEIARQRRASSDPQDEAIIASAIRSGASMLRANEAYRLLPLLEAGHSIDTCRVALKMIGRVFEVQPPARVDAYKRIATRVHEIAESLLNPYTVGVSETAAMAQLAIFALAAMASRKSLSIIRQVRGLEIAWFTRRTMRKLRELQDYRDSRQIRVAKGPSELLARAIANLDR